MPTERDRLLDSKILHLSHHALHVYHGERRGPDLYVTIELRSLVEKYGELTLAQLVVKFRSKHTRQRPTRISLALRDRNGDAASYCVFP